MGTIMQWLRGDTTGPERDELSEQLRQEQETSLLLQESIADLEQQMHEPGWQRLTAWGDQEFTREGLQRITAACRLYAIKNPLVKRGLSLRQSYVWGQGVNINARADGEDGGQDVNQVVQHFLTDNRKVLTGQQAHEELDRALGTDGNLFLSLWTSPADGRVQVRVLPWDQITDVITDPQDADRRWFYRRDWTADETDLSTGDRRQVRRTAYYPDVWHRPRTRRSNIGGHNVEWDAPVLHVRVNALQGWRFGVPDAYAALDWARAYKDFLEDWAKLVKSLSRIAWRMTSPGSKQAQAKKRLAQPAPSDPHTGEPQDAGGTAVQTPDMQLEAVPKSGATIDSESGRPLAMMVAAALDVPVTMLLSDPGQTGARATAETLDQPTELAMQARRELWADVLRDLLSYVVDQAVKAPRGPLSGTVTRDPARPDTETVELTDGTERTIDITFPDLDDADPVNLVEAIVKADGTTYLPPLTVARLLLETLGVTDVDEILEQLTDEQGNFAPPDGAGGAAGQAAVDAFRRGEDPATALSGGQQEEGAG